jgi:hypothetical protein
VVDAELVELESALDVAIDEVELVVPDKLPLDVELDDPLLELESQLESSASPPQ